MKCLVVSLLLLTAGLPLSVAADGNDPVAPAPTVQSVLNAYVRACGGDNLAAVQTVSKKGTLIRGNLGRVPLEIVSKAPGKWVYNQVFAYGDQVRYGFDGNVAWVRDGAGADPLPAGERLDLFLLLDHQAPLKLREFFPDMKIVNTEQGKDQELLTIAAVSREGIATTLVFDAGTGLLVRAGSVHYREYKAEGGIVIPHRIFFGAIEEANGLPLKMEITEVAFGQPVDDAIFARTFTPLPAATAPLFTSWKQVTVSDQALAACVGEYRHALDPQARFFVTVQDHHLMLERSGWGKRVEIKPVSELDYFIRFSNFQVHFVKDESGRIVQLEAGADRKLVAKRVN